MARYELTFLTRSEEDQVGVPELLCQLGATTENVVAMGRHKLAYPIKKETSAAYFSYLFTLEPTKVAELNQKLVRNDQVLRHLLIADGIRKGEEPKRKLKEKDLEVPASVQAGFGDEAASETGTGQTETSPVKSATLDEVLAPVEPKERGGEEITAEERQKKLDEKLKQILGND